MAIVGPEEVERSLRYLSQTDEPFGRAIARHERLTAELKVAKGFALLKAEGTVPVKEAKAYTSPEYRAKVEEIEECKADLEIMRAKRKRAELNVEVWRTESANARRGNI